MAWDFITIYTTWLGLFSISFTFMPMGLVMEWRKRGTADGFSSVNFVLPLTITACWLKHGYLTNDYANIYINTTNIGFFLVYIMAFAYYQPRRQYLIGQLATAAAVYAGTLYYVSLHDVDKQPDLMGNIAAYMQIAANAGGIYEIARVFKMGTTEYLPAVFQYALFVLMAQWLFFGIITNNIYIVRANLAGLAVNISTILLYFKYPPLTWRVPLIGTGPVQKKKD